MLEERQNKLFVSSNKNLLGRAPQSKSSLAVPANLARSMNELKLLTDSCGKKGSLLVTKADLLGETSENFSKRADTSADDVMISDFDNEILHVPKYSSEVPLFLNNKKLAWLTRFTYEATYFIINLFDSFTPLQATSQ